jgi:hypothetical protein
MWVFIKNFPTNLNCQELKEAFKKEKYDCKAVFFEPTKKNRNGDEVRCNLYAIFSEKSCRKLVGIGSFV